MIFDNENDSADLYKKYMAFNGIMLEDHTPLEIASIMMVQSMSFYRTVLSEEDYQSVVKNVYDQRDHVKTFND